MSDPINEIFNGTPEVWDEEKAKEAEAALEQVNADSQPMVADEDSPDTTQKYDVAPDSNQESKPSGEDTSLNLKRLRTNRCL